MPPFLERVALKNGQDPALTVVGETVQIHIRGSKVAEASRTGSYASPHGIATLLAPWCRLTGVQDDGTPAISVFNGKLWPQFSMAESDFVARRGSLSVGFRHGTVWKDEAGSQSLITSLTLRATAGPSEGAVLDLTARIANVSPTTVFLASNVPMLRVVFARALTMQGGGMVRTCALSGQTTEAETPLPARTPILSATGVIETGTTGLTILDHPINPGYPVHWQNCRTGDSAIMCATWASDAELGILPMDTLVLQVRIQTYCGYVDDGWLHARAADFAHTGVRN